MSEEKPIVYILRGDDRQAADSHLSTFFGSLGDADMAEMNTTRLEGKSATLNDLRAASLALPFLTERRLVIVEDALQPYSGRGKQKVREDFLDLMESLPPTTALVLIVPDTPKFSRYSVRGWETLKDSHWLIKWSETVGHRALLIDCALPTEDKMPLWIQNKAVELGGQFTGEAALLLRDYIGNDTRHAIQEITKLLTYAGFERPVEGKDVALLTVRDHQSDIFALVDAIGNRDGHKALEMLRILLDEMDFIPLFGMVIRQFRLLIQACEILELGGTEVDLVKTLGLHPYVAKKINVQSKKFNLSDLEKIYHHLLEIDLGEKTGRMPGEVALDLLIARLAG